MNEHDALIVTAVRAVETADRSRTLWSDADRAWASRAAAEVVGEAGRPEQFLARRAHFAFERMGTRYAPLRRAVGALRWRRWIGPALALAALAIGFAIDRIGAGRRIDLLAPPVLALIAWNLAVYAALVVSPLVRFARADDTTAGPLRRAVVRAAAHVQRVSRRGASHPLADAVAAFTTDWSQRAASLYSARAARILHIAAAMLALGLIAGLYVRGLAVEYRATWESTFLDAATVQRLLAFALWPASTLTGIPVPSVAELEAMRTSGAPASANAARWLHLLAATVAIVVVLPRLALAAWNGLFARYRATHFAFKLDEPYFQRVLRGFHGGPLRVSVVPYSYRVPPASLTGVQSLVSRVFGGSASLVVSSPVAYGDEEHAPLASGEVSGPVIALFNLAATAEREAHGEFVEQLRARAGRHPVIVIVDEGPYRERSGEDAARLDERRRSWRELFAERNVEPLFADLRRPDLAGIEAAIEARLDAVRG